MILYPGQEYDRNLSIVGSVFFSDLLKVVLARFLLLFFPL